MMALSPLKALLFLGGATGAGAGTAYVAGAFDPYLAPPARFASVNEPATPKAAAPGAPQTGEAGQKIAAADPKPGPTAPIAAADAPTPPSFDLLRVEPDGSVVIAGQAPPNSNVEVVWGSKVLAKVQADPDGAFVAVLDDPLKPGDYQIVLRSVGPGAMTLNSMETAVVSVPTDKAGDVLALVEQPGAPSKLITAPKAGDAAAAAPPAAGTPGPQPAPTSKGTQVPAAAPASGQPTVTVEAVEIEGRKIFVAGTAPTGATVRVYANELLLGDAKASPQGRFLIEAERDLKVGDYIIRADILSPDGAKVLARAAVPLTREAGDAVAAVAPQPDAAGAPASQPQAAVPSAAQTATTESPPPGNAAEQAAAAPDQAGETPSPSTAGSEPAAPQDGLAPKLQAAQGGVIIRRGDSLWQISKRVYGRGMRYSTIYTANRQQIENPDMIWPGQIFRVPEKSDKGDAADMKAIGDQATTVR